MGGRILSLVSSDKTLIYELLEDIDFEEKMYKKDVEIEQ